MENLIGLDCANPACSAPFEYRRGRIFGFHQSHPKGKNPRTRTRCDTSGCEPSAPKHIPLSITEAGCGGPATVHRLFGVSPEGLVRAYSREAILKKTERITGPSPVKSGVTGKTANRRLPHNGMKRHQAPQRAPRLVTVTMQIATPHLPSLGPSIRTISPISSWFAESLGWKLRITWTFMWRK